MRTLIRALALSVSFALPTAAQTVRDCETFEANARNTYGPYAETIRHYANGAIRVIALDVGEPAAASYHVMVTHPAGGEPFAACTLISMSNTLGFSSLDMAAIEAEYVPSTGLVVQMPATRFDGVSYHSVVLSLTVNQAAGTVDPFMVDAAAPTPPEAGK